MAKAIVITPTTGAPELKDAIRSVQNQTVDVEHLVICDGLKFKEKLDAVLESTEGKRPTVCYLPYNTGGGGFYGHRVMAAFSHLTSHDYVLFLDQDNWFKPNHVETLVNAIEFFNFDWAYSLRTIFDKDGNELVKDNCESLGRWPAWVGDNVFLVDSSSYCFKNSFLRQVGHIWDHGWGADRRFYTILREHVKHNNYGCTGLHTLNYRLGGNEGSVTKEFFIEGNSKMLSKYNGKNFPWLNEVAV